MKADSELDAMARQLAAFQTSQGESQRRQEELFLRYAGLLEDYRALRSDYEEETTNCERYKRMARGQDRNQFILMLVDGDKYIFNKQLVKGRAGGGAKAAQILEKSIRASLPRNETTCQVLVKVFADLATLSKALAREDLTGKESRSLAWFSSSFTRARNHFEFIDTGDNEGTFMKMCETFKLFIDSPQCKRVVFAGCSNSSYLPLLSPFRRRSDKVTLVKASGWLSKFEALGLAIAEYRSVFRSTSLPSTEAATQVSEKDLTQVVSDTEQQHFTATAHRERKSNSTPSLDRSPVTSSWLPPRSTSNQGAFSFSFPESSRALSSSNGLFDEDQSPSPSGLAKHVQSTGIQLPISEPGAEHMIPLNADHQRIDKFLPRPTRSAWEAFNVRSQKQKVCNEHHLNGARGGCRKGSACQFDHTPLTDEQLHALKAVLREYPCPRKTDCRVQNCYFGHMCVKEGCTRSGKGCKLKNTMHGLDATVEHWIEPEQEENEPRSKFSPKSESYNWHEHSKGDDHEEGELKSKFERLSHDPADPPIWKDERDKEADSYANKKSAHKSESENQQEKHDKHYRQEFDTTQIAPDSREVDHVDPSQQDATASFDSEIQIFEDTNWQADLAEHTPHNGGMNDNEWQSSSDKNVYSNDWNRPNKPTTETVDDGHWGDHADGTWDTQGWTDDPPEVTSSFSQPQKDFSFNGQATWEGESPSNSYTHRDYGQYQRQQQQTPQNRSGSYANAARGSRQQRGGSRGGTEKGRGNDVPSHQRQRGGSRQRDGLSQLVDLDGPVGSKQVMAATGSPW